eukprot:6187438-Pleurochrysis_carterae.AAC.1
MDNIGVTVAAAWRVLEYWLFSTKTGCSSVRDEFRKSTHRVARTSCCYRHFCASGSIWKDFKRYTGLILVSAASTQFLMAVHNLPFFRVVPGWRETSRTVSMDGGKKAQADSSEASK